MGPPEGREDIAEKKGAVKQVTFLFNNFLL